MLRQRTLKYIGAGVLSSEQTAIRMTSLAVWPATLLCLGWMLWAAFHTPGNLDDREPFIIQTGHWSTRLLLLVLAIAPLSRLLHQHWLRQCRRMLGLLAFAFCLAHAYLYIWSQRLWPHKLWYLISSPYLVVGLAASLLLVPLALTSSNAAMRFIGPAVWRQIHLGIYPATALVLAHECLYSHDSSSELIFHALVIGALFALRLRLPIIRRASSLQRPHR